MLFKLCSHRPKPLEFCLPDISLGEVTLDYYPNKVFTTLQACIRKFEAKLAEARH